MERTEELEPKFQTIDKLVEENTQSWKELHEAIPGIAMDTSDARLNMFIEFLTESGIMSDEQRLDFEIEFQNHIKQALDNTWEGYRKSKASRNILVPDNRGSLVDLHGNPL